MKKNLKKTINQVAKMNRNELLWDRTRENGILEFLDSGRKSWTLDSGRQTLDAGLWTLDAGLWILDPGLWTLDPGRYT